MAKSLPHSGASGRSWVDSLTGETAGRQKLAFASFLESTIVPIPLEALVAPLMFAHLRNAVRVAFAIWVGCLAGAFAFYLLARLFFDPLVRPALAAIGLADGFADMEQRLDTEDTFWTPVPTES